MVLTIGVTLLPHASLLRDVFHIPYDQGVPIIPRDQLEQENKMREVVEEEVAKLPAKEALATVLRYGLYSGVPQRLDEVEKKLKYTRERVRQTEEKVIRKLRHPAPLERFREFVRQ